MATLPPQSNETTTEPAMALPVDQQLFGVVIANVQVYPLVELLPAHAPSLDQGKFTFNTGLAVQQAGW